jgi:hypothetical protein
VFRRARTWQRFLAALINRSSVMAAYIDMTNTGAFAASLTAASFIYCLQQRSWRDTSYALSHACIKPASAPSLMVTRDNLLPRWTRS